jgi:hypothetical protein
MRRLILSLIILMGAICPLWLYADIDDWNTADWDTKVDKWNATEDANVAKINVTNVDDTNYLLDANLQACWRWENNTTDSTGNQSLTGLAGVPAYSTTVCVKGGTYSADSDAHFSSYDATPSANWPGKGSFTAMTICTWARFTNFDDGRAIASNYVYETAYYWYLLVNSSGKIVFTIFDNGNVARTITGNTTLSVNTNYFIAGTWDGSNLNVYLATDSTAPAADASAVSWSGTAKSGGGYVVVHAYTTTGLNTNDMLGYTDEIAVFNKCLSSVELTDIYNHGLDGAK